jgi:alpha-amylase
MEQQVQMYEHKMRQMQMQIRQLTLQLEMQAHTANAASYATATAASSSSATPASSSTTATTASSSSRNSSKFEATPSDSSSSSSGSSSSKACNQHTTVTFSIACPTAFGQRVWLVGDAAGLGSWNVSSGLALTWTEGGNWVGSVDLDAATTPSISYKPVLEHAPGKYQWASGENCQLALTAASHSVQHEFA